MRRIYNIDTLEPGEVIVLHTKSYGPAAQAVIMRTHSGSHDSLLASFITLSFESTNADKAGKPYKTYHLIKRKVAEEEWIAYSMGTVEVFAEAFKQVIEAEENERDRETA